MAADKCAPELITARHLSAYHIGSMIRFQLDDTDREITMVITAELRQISHNSAETYLTVGANAEREFTVDHDKPVVLSPAEDYGDWELWRVEPKQVPF